MAETAVDPEALAAARRVAPHLERALGAIDHGVSSQAALEMLETLRDGGTPEIGDVPEREGLLICAEGLRAALAEAGASPPPIRDQVVEAMVGELRAEAELVGLDWKLG